MATGAVVAARPDYQNEADHLTRRTKDPAYARVFGTMFRFVSPTTNLILKEKMGTDQT